MHTAMTVEGFPAKSSERLLLMCHRMHGRPWKAPIGGGPPATRDFLKSRLLRFPITERHLDLVVATHINNDHLGGMLPFFQSNIEGLTIRELPFNGVAATARSCTGRRPLLLLAGCLSAMDGGRHFSSWSLLRRCCPYRCSQQLAINNALGHCSSSCSSAIPEQFDVKRCLTALAIGGTIAAMRSVASPGVQSRP